MRNEDRKEIDEARELTGYSVRRFLPLLIVVVVILSVVGFGLNSLGYLGSTVVERKVFENSYQRSEAIKSQIATDEAALTEIKMQLLNPGLDDNTRFNLNAQAAAARVRINTAKGKQ